MSGGLLLPVSIHERMLRHAVGELPREAVGLVGGSGPRLARATEPLINIGGPYEFLADPFSQYQAERRLAVAGLEPIAVYHSHPGGAAALSDRDVHFASRVKLLQIVIAVASGGRAPEMRAFALGAPRVVEVPIDIVSDSTCDPVQT